MSHVIEGTGQVSLLGSIAGERGRQLVSTLFLLRIIYVLDHAHIFSINPLPFTTPGYNYYECMHACLWWISVYVCRVCLYIHMYAWVTVCCCTYLCTCIFLFLI